MDRFREKVKQRGTKDCPLSKYHFIKPRKDSLCATIHWHPEFEILHVSEGSIEVRVETELYTLTPGDICFIPPGKLHGIRSSSDNSIYDAFVFSLDLLTLPATHFFQKNLIHPLRAGTHCFPFLLKPDAPPFGTVSQALKQISSICVQSPHYKQVLFCSMVQVFTEMMPYLESCDNVHTRKGNDAIKECIKYLQTYYADHLTLPDIAKHVHLHPNYLCTLFREYTGQTVFQLLILIRIEKAAEALRSENRSISEIAAEYGFDNPCYFTKKFKEIIGCTPRQYAMLHM